jgi:hypothetical protein
MNLEGRVGEDGASLGLLLPRPVPDMSSRGHCPSALLTPPGLLISPALGLSMLETSPVCFSASLLDHSPAPCSIFLEPDSVWLQDLEPTCQTQISAQHPPAG